MRDRKDIFGWVKYVFLGGMTVFTIFLLIPAQVGQVTTYATVSNAHIYETQSCGIFACSSAPHESVVFTLPTGANFSRSYSCSYFTQGMKVSVIASYQVSRIFNLFPIIPANAAQYMALPPQTPIYVVQGVPFDC